MYAKGTPRAGRPPSMSERSSWEHAALTPRIFSLFPLNKGLGFQNSLSPLNAFSPYIILSIMETKVR
nr:hypothetical protein Q903MT_gene5326 [Picea sitchensis]